MSEHIQAYMVTDCDEPTTGYIDSKSHDKPLLIFLSEQEAYNKQCNILGELWEVEVRRVRKSGFYERSQEQWERAELKRLKEKYEIVPENQNTEQADDN